MSPVRTKAFLSFGALALAVPAQAQPDPVSPARLRADVEKLVTFGTRHTLSSQDDPVRGIGQRLHLAARVHAPDTGIGLELLTDQPGVQIYTCGQMTPPVPGKAGQSYGRFAGLTLETQVFPGSPNHLHFPSCRLDPGQVYSHAMQFRFSRTDGGP